MRMVFILISNTREIGSNDIIAIILESAYFQLILFYLFCMKGEEEIYHVWLCFCFTAAVVIVVVL